MKKLLLVFLLIFSLPTFATGINGASAPCDNATLAKYTGTADIEINWEPNVIGLKWYNGDQQVAGPTSCVYDSTITVPPQPTKLGYTFNGWKIPKMDFATIPTDVNGTERWSITWVDNANYCWYDSNVAAAQHVECNSDSTYTELEPYKWKVRFSHGDLYGISIRSSTSGTAMQSGTPSTSTGLNCWCKATGYKAANSSIVNNSLYSLPWVYHSFNGDYSDGGDCNMRCVMHCAYHAKYYQAFRVALFTPVQ